MTIKLAWRNIWRNRKRTLITMGSIVFAVLLAILLNSLKEGILVRLQENVVSFYSGAIQIHQKGYWDEKSLDHSFRSTDTLVDQVLAHPQVTSVIGRLESFVLAASEDHTRGCLLVGIEPDKEPEVTSLDEKVAKGSYLTNEDQSILIAEGLAEYLRLDVGDTLVIIGQGYHGVNAADKYPIKGIIHFASPELNKNMIYLPIKQAQQLFGAPDRLTALVLAIDDINHASTIEKELTNSLPADYEIMGWKTLMPELNQVLEGERAENAVFLVILYILIAFGIFGTVLMMTLERQYEFGVLIAIGMRKLRLSNVVIFENFMISLLGACTGTLLSIPLILYFYTNPIQVGGELQKAYEDFGFEPVFYFSIAPQIFYSQTLVVLGIALVLSIYPLFKIHSLDPVQAMRSA